MGDHQASRFGKSRKARKSKRAPVLAACKRVTVSFGHNRVLENVKLKVRQGEIVTVIGPNGAGKSTLIKVMLGLIKPTSGLVYQSDNLSVGYVPQKLLVDETLPISVYRLMTLTQRGSRKKAQEALQETGMQNSLDQPVHTLSGGEFQRVMLARALMRRPALMVLDEPTQGVDVAGEAALYALIGSIRERYGCAILMISHDLHFVMGTTDRVVCLNRTICCKGKPKKVIRHPEFTRLFGTQHAQQFAFYTHHHHGHHVTGNEDMLASSCRVDVDIPHDVTGEDSCPQCGCGHHHDAPLAHGPHEPQAPPLQPGEEREASHGGNTPEGKSADMTTPVGKESGRSRS